MMAFYAKQCAVIKQQHKIQILFLLLCLGPDLILTWDSVCEPINIETCQGLGYELTTMPNLLGHESQLQANREVRMINNNNT